MPLFLANSYFERDEVIDEQRFGLVSTLADTILQMVVGHIALETSTPTLPADEVPIVYIQVSVRGR